jgi:hypothetical protein
LRRLRHGCHKLLKIRKQFRRLSESFTRVDNTYTSLWPSFSSVGALSNETCTATRCGLARRERLTTQAAFTEAGYNAKQNAPRLRNNEAVAKRIEELQTRNERKAEMAALSRDELIGFLADIARAARSRLSEARTETDSSITMGYEMSRRSKPEKAPLCAAIFVNSVAGRSKCTTKD